MLTMRRSLVYIFGFMQAYFSNVANCRNVIPDLKNTLSDDEQNIGEKCFNNVNMVCPKDMKYKSINGFCTNLKFPIRGTPETVYTRLLPALYQDSGNSVEKGSRIIRTKVDGNSLPSARVVSNVFFTSLKEDSPVLFDKEFTLSLLTWGQVITHDMSATINKDGPSCCTDKNQRFMETFPNCKGVKLPTNDRFYSKFNRTCLSVSRPKDTDDLQCQVGPVLTINYVTAPLDGSYLYGSTEDAMKQIRSYENGHLKFQIIHDQVFPPNEEAHKSTCRLGTDEVLCIQAGNTKSNLHAMLAVLQTVSVRLHNNIADSLAKINRGWNDETLFQEARRITVAIVQHITYAHYLPNIINKDYLKNAKVSVPTSGYSNVYDESVNHQMMTEFMQCAFRRFHSSITDKVVMVNENREAILQWKFSEFFNAVGFITENDNFNSMIRGMATNPQGNIGRHFATSITDLLFQIGGVGADLEVLDIVKGRFTGINKYTAYLEMIGMPKINDWNDYTNYMPKNMVDRLQKIYKNVDDVELFVGGILEYNANGSTVGPTFQAIITEQFGRIQMGDSFFYCNEKQPYPFTTKQLEQIQKVSLAYVYCFTCKEIKRMQRDVFRQISDKNPLVNCEDIIRDFSFDPWTATTS